MLYIYYIAIEEVFLFLKQNWSLDLHLHHLMSGVFMAVAYVYQSASLKSLCVISLFTEIVCVVSCIRRCHNEFPALKAITDHPIHNYLIALIHLLRIPFILTIILATLGRVMRRPTLIDAGLHANGVMILCLIVFFDTQWVKSEIRRAKKYEEARNRKMKSSKSC